LEIRIRAPESDAAGYPAEAQLETGGHFGGGLLRLDQSALRTASSPEQYGRLLSAALFTGPIRDAYLKATVYAETLTENRLRLRLWIDRTAAELHAISWELLRVDDVLVSANAATPFSRYLPATTSWQMGGTAFPLRALVAISAPEDLSVYRLPPVDARHERAVLKQALVDQKVRLDVLEPPVTLPRLEAKLREGYDILHYVGHGAVGKAHQEPVLHLQDEDDMTALVKGERLGAMLARQGVRPHLVVLSACKSATVTTADAYVALGPQLIQRGVPAVVAMRGRISQASARIFSRTLYTRLLAHGVVDQAVNEARSALVAAERPDAAVPVLFMRLKDGRLWRREDAVSSQRDEFETHPSRHTAQGASPGGPDTATLRKRLRRLDSVEITSLCLDYFPKVYDKFGRGLRRDEMINLLLEHCRRYPDDARRLSDVLE
jgi:hypothetical protein